MFCMIRNLPEVWLKPYKKSEILCQEFIIMSIKLIIIRSYIDFGQFIKDTKNQYDKTKLLIEIHCLSVVHILTGLW